MTKPAPLSNPHTHDTAPQSGTQLVWLGIVTAMILPTLITWLYFDALSQELAWRQQIAMGGGKIVQFSFPLFWFICVLRHRTPKLNLRMEGMMVGVCFGLAVCGGIWLVYHYAIEPLGYLPELQAALRQKLAGLQVNTAGKFFVLAAFYAVAHSLLEEYYWRWFVFGQLCTRLALGPAVLISGLGFMAHHVLVLAYYFGWFSVATWFLSFSVAIGGMCWALMMHRYKNLTTPWMSHLLVDAGIFAIGYFLVAPF